MKRLFPFLLLSMILFSCSGDEKEAQPEEIPADEFGPESTYLPFTELGIRFDGYYKEERGGVIYLIRFFPNGNAVLINGLPETGNELPSYLTQDAIGDPGMGWYNVPITVREDSIFFKTYPFKGEISYRGNVPGTSTVRLLRHSHINGERTIKEYVFQPDPPASM